MSHEDAAAEDFAFWFAMTGAERVELMTECLLDWMKTQESVSYPDFEEFIESLNVQRVRYLRRPG